jgi:hypothetical protein
MRPSRIPDQFLPMKHETRHAIGLWIVAAVLGGFAVAAWVSRTVDGDEERRSPPAESYAASAEGASSPSARRT